MCDILFFLLFFFCNLSFFFFLLQCMIPLRVFRVAVWTIDDVLLIIFVMTVSVTMNSGGLQGGFYGVVWLMAFVLRLVT